MRKKTIKCQMCDKWFTYIHRKGGKTRSYCDKCIKIREKDNRNKSRINLGMDKLSKSDKALYQLNKLIIDESMTENDLKALINHHRKEIAHIDTLFKQRKITMNEFYTMLNYQKSILKILAHVLERKKLDYSARGNPEHDYNNDKEHLKKTGAKEKHEDNEDIYDDQDNW